MIDPNWQKCLLQNDSKKMLKQFPDNSIDLILTDPPYNIGKHSTGNISLYGRATMNNDIAEWDCIDFKPEEWADEFVRILKPTGNLFIFTSYNQLGSWYNCLDHRFDTSNFMIWHKTNPAPKIFKAGFLNSCEMIFTCWNKRHTWNFISQKEMHNFIESPICMRPERLNKPKHPTQKPISILEKIIKIASNESDIVFDPFMGVGSIGVAALNLNRKFIGIELDEEYFQAAKERIETMKSIKNIRSDKVCEDPISYRIGGYNLTDVLPFVSSKQDTQICEKKSSNRLQPIIKWAGGKEREIKHILPNLPTFNRYFEPFVGGGAVYTAIQAKEYFINDLSSELISLYKNIAFQNPLFFTYIEDINKTWKQSKSFFDNNMELIDIYTCYRNNDMDKFQLKERLEAFIKERETKIHLIIKERLAKDTSILIKEMHSNLLRKMVRMKELEVQKGNLPITDLYDNIETAIKSAVYMYFRAMYNGEEIVQRDMVMHCALFFFIRNYSYSGMFRYNDEGKFNVPYGGIGYNKKVLEKKIDYYKSKALIDHFRHTQIFNLDFERFLIENTPYSDDFIFLDPPYDSEFSTYAKNEFTKTDHRRLANYLINKCEAKWMLIIKNTDFIYDLYNHEGIRIRSFEKKYLVSFMNRNDKKVTHLLITNYE